LIFGLLILIQQLIASLSHIIAKDITLNLPPILVLFLRGSIAALLFSLWIFFRKAYKIKIHQNDWLKIILLGLINIPINQFLFFLAIEKTTAPNVSLAYALTPIFVFIIAIFYLREKVKLIKLIGIIIAMIGTIILLSEKGFKFSYNGILGDILALTASLSWAFYTIIGKNLTSKYNPIYITGLTMIIGWLLYLPIFIFSDIHLVNYNISIKSWLQLLYLGAFTSAIGYAIWYYALTKIEASKLSVFNNIQPALTTLLSFLFFSTPITIYFVIGGTLIISGVYLTQRS